jgi:serine/threonine protein kinase
MQRESSRESSLVSELISREPSPEEAVAAADELELLLKHLPDREREAVVLALQGYEQQEIATRLQCAERTVRRWLASAKRRLIERGGGGFVPSAARRPPADFSRRTLSFSAEVALEAPLPWSDFLLQKQIGVGATGKVYGALQRSSGKQVAVKFLKKALLHDRSMVERFVQEAKMVADLQHPGIVAVHGIGRTPGGGLFLLMDLVRGQDLERIGRSEAVDIAQAARWVAEAARIVQFAHERGIIHCDLKPSNLLCDEQGSIRVTDFGFALRLVGGEASPDRLAGTPAFMAPEQVDQAWGEIAPQTDVWGLGSILYSLVFGVAPHGGRDIAETLSFVVSGKPVPLVSDCNAHMPAALLSVLGRCLAKRPEDRFATALELAQALQETNSGLVGLPRPGRLSVAASRRVQS